ncbi:hypothetical protein [Amycolatopsis anabasis]|uniref:hypothetical protein n=1 Tax=Amycolatopsis anabasis TaxID=1840409 RepID=UPI001FE87CC3|nr:hypothetical protein [Amycolatopsis anabasis]
MPQDQQRLAAEIWFRRRGLPMVVRRESRGRALVQRSVPALVFLLCIEPLLSLLLPMIDIPQDALDARFGDSGYVLGVLALTGAAIVVPVLAGWLVGRWVSRSGELPTLYAGIAIVLVEVFVLPAAERAAGLLDRYWMSAAQNAVQVLLVLLLVRIGAGSILLWAVRSAGRQVGTLGTLASRALPLLLLVVMFSFFTGELWQAADHLTRRQLWVVVGFLAVVGVLFISAVLSDELRALRSAPRPERDLTELLRNTPLEGEVPGKVHSRLSKTERANIVLVLFFAQLVQIVAFAVLVFVFFIVFGALMIQPEVVEAYAGRPSAPGTLFGIRLPVSTALVQVSLFLSVFSGLYFAASTATDAHYRRSFFQPLLDDVALSLAARDVYRARWADA